MSTTVLVKRSHNMHRPCVRKAVVLESELPRQLDEFTLLKLQQALPRAGFFNAKITDIITAKYCDKLS